MTDLTWLEGFLPLGLTPSSLNDNEDVELKRRFALAPTLTTQGASMATKTPALPGKAGALSTAWRIATDAATKLSPELISKTQALVNKASPGATLSSLVSGSSLEGKKMAVELMARAGYDMNKVDLVFRAYGVAQQAEVMMQVQDFLTKEVILNDSTKVDIASSTLQDSVLFGQMNMTRDNLGLANIDDLLLLSNVLAQLSSKAVIEYKAFSAINARLAYR